MSIPIHCSSALFTRNLLTDLDFTASFTYQTIQSAGIPTENDGFSFFFIDGAVPSIYGGGIGHGLGTVSSTDTSSTSAVSGIFLTVGLDNLGYFSQNGSIPVFVTGTPNPLPQAVVVRNTTDFTYVTSVSVGYPNVFALDTEQTIRIRMRKRFQQLFIDSLQNDRYVNLLTYNTNLSSVPSTAKFGIAYSGDALFTIKWPTLNYTN